MPWSDSAYYLSLIWVAYTDADTIKAVAEEKLEGVLSELNRNGSGYDAE
jgi:hypothetical protein